MGKVLFIINPTGHGGTAAATWAAFRGAWGDEIDRGDVMVTQRAGHARELAATDVDHEILAAVGGDGTVGEVISGVMDRSGPRPKVAIVPGGTGNDIARNFGVHPLDASVAALRDGGTREVDIMRVAGRVDGRRAQRYAVMYAGVGFSGIPLVKPWMKRVLGPKVAYNVATVAQIALFQVPRLTLRSDEEQFEGLSWMVLTANLSRTAGGTQCLSPTARFDDGLLDITIWPARPKLAMVTQLFPKVASGAYVDEPDVRCFRTKELEVVSDPPCVVDLDGDIFGTTPVTISVCHRAVTVVCPPPAPE